jgi:hypothetical protein
MVKGKQVAVGVVGEMVGIITAERREGYFN